MGIREEYLYLEQERIWREKCKQRDKYLAEMQAKEDAKKARALRERIEYEKKHFIKIRLNKIKDSLKSFFENVKEIFEGLLVWTISFFNVITALLIPVALVLLIIVLFRMIF